MPTASPIKAGPGRIEFVLLISSVMMLVAFAIDSMLPAMPQIGTELGVSNINDRPFIITAFIIGFSVALLLTGAVTDALGRRTLLIYGLSGFAISSLACTLATSFDLLLAARVVQGMAAGVGQIVIRSVVRDKFEGRDMAQVMSLAGMIFMFAPILAPTLGQIVLEFGPWRWIFAGLGLLGFIVWLWTLSRIEETLPPEDRNKMDRATLIAGVRTVASDRMSVGYSLAFAFLSTGMFGFLLSIQQIFEQGFKRADFLPIGFAIMAAGMAVASLINASFVKRYGMRRIGHAALILFIFAAGAHLALALSGRETLTLFITLQTFTAMAHSLCMGNFNAMAMENMGKVAGLANSLQGILSNLVGVGLGTLIGQHFDGTTVPLYTGFFAVGLVSLGIVLATEGGRLFVARHEPKTAE